MAAATTRPAIPAGTVAVGVVAIGRPVTAEVAPIVAGTVLSIETAGRATPTEVLAAWPAGAGAPDTIR